MRQRDSFHILLTYLLTVSIVVITGVLQCHHSYGNPSGRVVGEPRARMEPAQAVGNSAPLVRPDPHCGLCAAQRLLTQSWADEIQDLIAPGPGPDFAVDVSTRPTVNGVRSVEARSPPLS